MSISSEIVRIQSAKSDIITAIENKSVTVPTGATIDELPELIDSIPSGGGLPAGYEIIGDKVYRTCEINGKIWTAQNLDYAFENCTITTTPPSSTSTVPVGLYKDESYRTAYGLLYNWYAVKYLEDNKSDLLPGWRIPTSSDFQDLINYVVDKVKIKSFIWNGTDDYKFSALPTGWSSGGFSEIGTGGGFFTSTEFSGPLIYYLQLNENFFRLSDSQKHACRGIRLIKDV